MAPKPVKLSLGNVISALSTVNSCFSKYDVDRSGQLSLDEATALLNGPELRTSLLTLANVEVPHRTKDDLQPYFKKADSDRSGALSRTEFMAMYLAVATERVKQDPLVLAEGLLGFIDADRNGKIQGGELKVLLAILGFPAALVLPIPGFISVDYRSIIDSMRGGNKDSKK